MPGEEKRAMEKPYWEGKHYAFLTNNSSTAKKEYMKRFQRLGLEVTEKEGKLLKYEVTNDINKYKFKTGTIISFIPDSKIDEYVNEKTLVLN